MDDWTVVLTRFLGVCLVIVAGVGVVLMLTFIAFLIFG